MSLVPCVLVKHNLNGNIYTLTKKKFEKEMKNNPAKLTKITKAQAEKELKNLETPSVLDKE